MNESHRIYEDKPKLVTWRKWAAIVYLAILFAHILISFIYFKDFSLFSILMSLLTIVLLVLFGIRFPIKYILFEDRIRVIYLLGKRDLLFMDIGSTGTLSKFRITRSDGVRRDVWYPYENVIAFQKQRSYLPEHTFVSPKHFDEFYERLVAQIKTKNAEVRIL